MVHGEIVEGNGSETEVNTNKLSNVYSNDIKTDSEVVNSQKENSNNSRPDTFEEFSSYTTLHGVRFIGDHDSFIPRRFLWLCIVLLSATLFTFQVVDRVQYYLQSPITVNLKVNYNKSLAFPAVTICNQNLFKLSVANREDLINVIKTWHGYQENIFDYRPNLTLDVLYTELAHQKEDLIIKCRWGKQECYPENFTTTFTSHGVCYTFNKVDSLNDALMVHASGVDHGLKLTLNTEKFEKMVGPHKTDGIKVIATDQSEMPNVEEVGISISAGVHAYVGLKVLSMNNLEPPYGRCGEHDLLTTDRYTPDSCILECQTHYLKEQCDCRHYYMPNLDGSTRVCNMQDLRYCVQDKLEYFKEMESELCDCSTSCVYNIYESTVFYSIKSEWQTDFENEFGYTKTNEIIDKYEAARKINSEMDTGEYWKLEFTIQNAVISLAVLNRNMKMKLASVAFYKDGIERYFTKTVEASTRRTSLYALQTFILDNIFIQGYNTMEESTLVVLCQSYREFSNKIKYILNNNERLEIQTKQILFEEMIYNKLNIANEAYNAYIYLFSSYEQGVPILKNYTFTDFNNTVINAAIPKQLLNSLLNDSTAYQTRFLIIEDLGNIENILKSLKIMSDSIFINQTHGLDMEDFTPVSNEFVEMCKGILARKSQLYKEVVEKPLIILNQRKETLFILQARLKTAYENIETQMRVMYDTIEEITLVIIPELENNLYFIMEHNGYKFKGNFTKLHVAREFSQFGILSNLNQLDVLIVNINSLVSEYLSVFMKRLDDVWKHLLVFNGDNRQYDLLMNDLELSQNYSERIQNIYEDLGKIKFSLNSMTEDRKTPKAVEDIELVKSKMNDFVKSYKVGDDLLRENLLEVDVYFKELRSEQLDQQKAYDEFALLCDIGGSMGLFIGGSAITFFEVVDFLILCFVHKVARRRI